MSNTALLSIAGVLENMRTALINGDGVSYNHMEVLLASMQATIEILCGGAPSSIVLPKIQSAAGLDDATVARFCNGTIAASPYIPGGANFVAKSGVLADGSQTPITFPVAFPNTCLGVLCTPMNYSGGSNNAGLVANVIGLPTTTGFTAMVGGGESGSTCTLVYFPVGT